MINDYVLIVDDQADSLAASADIVREFVSSDKVLTASGSIEALRQLDNYPVKLAFLDIDMPDTSGFAVADYIHNTFPGVKCVFLTGYADFAAESYNYDAFDFLTKPVDPIRLKKTFEKYQSKEPRPVSERIAVETGNGFALINPDEVFYITKDARNTVIKCVGGQEYVVHQSLEALEVIFGDYAFFRTHQSYLVPLNSITSVQPAVFGKTYDAVLSDGTRVPVSRATYPKLREHLIEKGVKFL